MKQRAFLSLILLFGVITPSLGQAQTLPGDKRGTTRQADTTSDKAAPAAHLQLRPCVENAALDCGTLNVPVDYNRPGGEKVGLAVIRARTTNPARRIGVLLIGPLMGPSQSGIDFVLFGINLPTIQRLRERFDIVSLDVRGSHRSRPVQCTIDAVGDPAQLDEAGQIALLDNFSRRLAQACLAQNGAFVLSMSTNNIARDLEVLRRALKERQISFYGSSFNTVTGAVYASLFPQRVRAMVLEAGVPPAFRDYWTEFIVERAAAFELVLRHVERLCQRDAACLLRETGVVAALETVMARLHKAPVTSPDGSKLTDKDVRNVVALLLHIEPLWPQMVNGLAAALAEEYTLFFQFAQPAKAVIRLAIEETTFDAFDAIVCNDYGTRRSAAETLALGQSVDALYPHFFGRFYVAGEVARCASWSPADPPIIRNVRARVATPILMIGNQFNPATPLSWTRSLAHTLGMERSLVRYLGGGLVAATIGIPCVEELMLAYLFDLTVPTEGVSCPAQPIPFTSVMQTSIEADLNQTFFRGFLPPIKR